MKEGTEDCLEYSGRQATCTKHMKLRVVPVDVILRTTCRWYGMREEFQEEKSGMRIRLMQSFYLEELFEDM